MCGCANTSGQNNELQSAFERAGLRFSDNEPGEWDPGVRLRVIKGRDDTFGGNDFFPDTLG